MIEYLDDTIKTLEDIERTTKLPTLGSIARIEGKDYPEKLIALRNPLAPSVEPYRVLRTNILYSSVNKTLRTLLMIGPGPREGKSVCLANLSVVMAQSNLKVIVVDSDLRRPVQHEIFGLSNESGLSDLILHPNSGVNEYLQATEVDNLRILTCGPIPPNPAELLGSDRMKEIIEELKAEVDFVLFDSPPSLLVADAVILGTRVDGVIMINDVGHTRFNQARRAAEEMRRVQANLLGVVLNRFSQERNGYYYYYQKDSQKEKKRKQA